MTRAHSVSQGLGKDVRWVVVLNVVTGLNREWILFGGNSHNFLNTVNLDINHC